MRTSSENVTSRNHFSIIQTHYAWKRCSNYPGIKFGTIAWDLFKKTKLNICHHMLTPVHTPATLVISSLRKNESVYKMPKNEKCACKACKTTVFHCLIIYMKKILHSDWLRAVQFFSKTVQKRGNLVQKEETNQAFWLVNDQRNLQMANQIFCFQIKRTPWMAQLMA